MLFLVYLAGGDLLPTTDAIGNMHLALSLLDEGNLSFTALEKPFMFRWNLTAEDGQRAVVVKRWTDTIHGLPTKALFEHGVLRRGANQYYIVQSKRADASGEPLFVNTSGPGPAIAALPIFALSRIFSGSLERAPASLWHTGKFTASLYVAISAGLVYLAARQFVPRRSAIVVTLAYGLGTCVWSISSQALWQHPSNELFLALGLLLLFLCCGKWPFFGDAVHEPGRAGGAPVLNPIAGQGRGGDRACGLVFGCGLALSCATACRPTSGMMLAAIGVYFLCVDRRRLVYYIAGAAPVLVALAAYNTYYLGAPWSFGQTAAGHELAREKVGTPGAWQTPLWEGLAGDLISPSRGLLIYSPFLAASVLGGWLAWRRSDWKMLRPVAIGTLLMLIVEAKHYDWWGGWTYGYRHIVDLVVPMAMLVAAAMTTINRRRWLPAIFWAAVAWSIGVQFIGAYSYDESWNGLRAGYELKMAGSDKTVRVQSRAEARDLIARGATPVKEIRLDIDDPQYRYRLWSWRDWEIGYYFSHFRAGRAARHSMTRQACQNPG